MPTWVLLKAACTLVPQGTLLGHVSVPRVKVALKRAEAPEITSFGIHIAIFRNLLEIKYSDYEMMWS